MDARRPRRHRHARGLSGKERRRPILGDRSRYRVTMFSGVPTLYAALIQTPLGDSDISSLRFAICGPRRCRRPHPRFRGKDGSEDSRRLRPHGRRLRFVSQSGRRRAARGLDRPAHPLSADGSLVSCLMARGRFQRMADRRRGRRHPRSAGPMSSRAISTPCHNAVCPGSTSTASAGLNTGDSAGRTRTVLLAHRAEEGTHHPRRPQHRSR